GGGGTAPRVTPISRRPPSPGGCFQRAPPPRGGLEGAPAEGRATLKERSRCGAPSGEMARHAAPGFPMLIGYVSDERYVALPDAVLEFTSDRGESFEARSRASGAVHLHVPPGDYKVAIQKPGF